jgi:chitinase
MDFETSYANGAVRILTLSLSTILAVGALGCGGDEGAFAANGGAKRANTARPGAAPWPTATASNATNPWDVPEPPRPTTPSAPTTPNTPTAPNDSAAPPDAGASAPPASTSGRWVMGYYVGYQQDIYPPSAIDFSAITHLAVGRIVPNANGSLTTTFDTHDGPALAKTLSGLTHAAGRRAILMLGGAGAHNAWSSAASNANRATFVRNLAQTLTAYGYDGFDVDWEPINAADEPLLKALVSDLRAALPSAILTIPVSWSAPTNAAFYKAIGASFDQVNIMSYSMADTWPGWSAWHSSALMGETPTTPSSVDRAVKGYLAAGIPAAKLGVGIGFYGTCWAGGITGPMQAVGGSRVASADNAMSYTNIMAQYFAAPNRKWDPTAKVPYLSFPGGKGAKACSFLSYEDEQSILEKGAYAKSKGLGGTIIWTINQGYVPDAAPGAKNPLLTATKKAFLD